MLSIGLHASGVIASVLCISREIQCDKCKREFSYRGAHHDQSRQGGEHRRNLPDEWQRRRPSPRWRSSICWCRRSSPWRPEQRSDFYVSGREVEGERDARLNSCALRGDIDVAISVVCARPNMDASRPHLSGGLIPNWRHNHVRRDQSASSPPIWRCGDEHRRHRVRHDRVPAPRWYGALHRVVCD